jgi:hypothetical protein
VRAAIDVGGCGAARRVLAVRPRVTATRRSVTVLLRVRLAPQEPPPAPDAPCPDVGYFKIVDVPLGRRLGHRTLYDASFRPKRLPFPPRA